MMMMSVFMIVITLMMMISMTALADMNMIIALAGLAEHCSGIR
jgi:hypothetical protein